jgi:hypothetical protein
VSDYFSTAWRTLLALLAVAGGVNVVVDPGEQWARADVGPEWFARYADALAGAPHGLPYVGAGRERELKLVLGATTADCHVIGSSRASQLSSVRGGSIRALCPTLVNLWVPGGSFEDLTVLAWRSLASDTPTLVLVIDPWMLGYRATPGWRAWGERHDRARAAFGLRADPAPRTPERDRVLAAFSLPAFFASLSLIARHGADLEALYRPPVPAALPPYDLRRGHPGDATLPDGSRVYARAVLADARRGRMERIRRHEVPRSVDFDARALAELDAIVAHLREAGRRVVLARAPFHPDVFTDHPERVAAHLAPAEARLDALAARHGLARFGSYRPDEVGCGPVEFKDLRHPLPECLDRIDWRRPLEPPVRSASRDRPGPAGG